MTSGIMLTRADMKELQEAAKTERVKDSAKSIDQKLVDHFIRFRGKGRESIARYLKKYPESAKRVAELYPKFKLARNAADVYIKIIKELEESEPLPTKVDLACGPGMLGISLNEPTIGIDIDPYMLKTGREIYPQNKLLEGAMESVPLTEQRADLVVCSLAFQMTNPKTKERERTLREINRILKRNGKAIIVINEDYLDQKDEQRLYDTLVKIGFDINQDYTGIKQAGRSKFRVYTLNKTTEPQPEPLDTSYLTFKGDMPKYRSQRK